LGLVLLVLAPVGTAAGQEMGRAPLLVVVPPGLSVAGRVELERLWGGLEAAGAGEMVAALGLVAVGPPGDVAAARRACASGREAYFRAEFGVAEASFREALKELRSDPFLGAGDSVARGELYGAAVYLFRLVQAGGGAPCQDAEVAGALRAMGGGPLSEDEYPGDLIQAVRGCEAHLAACSVELKLSGRAGLEGARLEADGRALDLGLGAVALPCGEWRLRLHPGQPAAWEHRLTLAQGGVAELTLSSGLEQHLARVPPGRLEAADYPQLEQDLAAALGGRAARLVRVSEGPAGLALEERRWDGEAWSDVAAPAGAAVAVAPQGDEVAPVRPEARSTLRRWSPWLVGGASAAALGVAVALNLQANRWADRQNQGQDAYFQRVDAYRTGAAWGYGVAAGLAASSAAWFLLDNLVWRE
jgi:hypothetical protein